MSISRISFCGDSKNPIKPMQNKNNLKNLSKQNFLDPLDYLSGYLEGKSIRNTEEMKEFLTKSQFCPPVKAYRDGFKAATGVKLPESSVFDKMAGKMMEKLLKLGVSYSSSEAAGAHQTASKVMAKIADLVTVKPFKLKN
ncbi:hypothetical protein DBY21_07205 [Candidatus Gastranaerophilales bacterium]|nr:MAG: hypothetical protein DBY21_07205 [Candidatus Gastranaerophilales bacterium]